VAVTSAWGIPLIQRSVDPLNCYLDLAPVAVRRARSRILPTSFRTQTSVPPEGALLPEFRDRIGFIDCESYADCLTGTDDTASKELAGFLMSRIAAAN
jgi:hypothetical protein